MTDQTAPAYPQAWALRIVRMVAPSEQIIGPFVSAEAAGFYLDSRRADLNLHPHVAPQIMPLDSPDSAPASPSAPAASGGASDA